MVQSNIHQSIHYQETVSVSPEDKNREFTVHEIKLYSIPVSICLGMVQSQFSSSYGVLYAPIYLVKPNGRVTPIGVFEFKTSKYKYLKDEDGDLDVSKLQRPLLYSFATMDYISRIVHGLEKHKLEIDERICETLKEKEKQEEEYMQIIKQEREHEETKRIVQRIHSPDLSTHQVYQKNKSRKNRRF
jgi:hypothetical protein